MFQGRSSGGSKPLLQYTHSEKPASCFHACESDIFSSFDVMCMKRSFLTDKIRPKQKQPPRIYGVPKIHKTNVPLRLIVSCVNTFAYDLSGFLARILSPLTGNSNLTLKNSGEFASIISQETIQADEVMISFDVESLFTNVPIEGAVEAALNQRSLRNPSPQPTARGNTHRLQVRHHAKISTGQT